MDVQTCVCFALKHTVEVAYSNFHSPILKVYLSVCFAPVLIIFSSIYASALDCNFFGGRLKKVCSHSEQSGTCKIWRSGVPWGCDLQWGSEYWKHHNSELLLVLHGTMYLNSQPFDKKVKQKVF